MDLIEKLKELHAETPLRPGEKTLILPDKFDAGLFFIGYAHTPWTERSACPRQGDPENGPECILELAPRWSDALCGLEAYTHIQLLYWMHQARRDLVLQRPGQGSAELATKRATFALRSPVRPNPIASSTLRLLDMKVTEKGAYLHVRGLDCLDGTPFLDIKPVFSSRIPETSNKV